ncbi:septum formation initiator family protein [bacterium]|nr:septum formation initiator family protein [bacterium]
MHLVEKKDFNLIFYILASVIFVVFLIFLLSGEKGLIHLHALGKIKRNLENQNHTALQENLSLRYQVKSLYESDAVEHLAKETLGLINADEVVYIIK